MLCRTIVVIHDTVIGGVPEPPFSVLISEVLLAKELSEGSKQSYSECLTHAIARGDTDAVWILISEGFRPMCLHLRLKFLDLGTQNRGDPSIYSPKSQISKEKCPSFCMTLRVNQHRF